MIKKCIKSIRDIWSGVCDFFFNNYPKIGPHKTLLDIRVEELRKTIYTKYANSATDPSNSTKIQTQDSVKS
jgi:hypothetical protein